MGTILWILQAAAASPLVRSPDPIGAVVRGVSAELADDPEMLRPAVAAWLAAGGDAGTATALLLSGARRGCTGECAPALLAAARDALGHGLSPEGAAAVVLEAQHDTCWRRLLGDRPVTDLEVGLALRASVAARLLRAVD